MKNNLFLNKKLNNLALISISIFIFLTNDVNAGVLLSPDEIYGDSETGGGNTTTAVIMFLIPILFIVGLEVVGRAKRTNIEKENAKRFKEFIEKISVNVEMQDLAKRINDYGVNGLFLNANERHYFFSLHSAEEKEKEINSGTKSLAFIMKSQASRHGMWETDYVVLEFNK